MHQSAVKPSPDASEDVKRAFITKKYKDREFVVSQNFEVSACIDRNAS